MNLLSGIEPIKEVRRIIKSNDFLCGIKTSGKGRTKHAIINEINGKIMLFNNKNNGMNDKCVEIQQMIQFTMTDILLHHQETSLDDLRFLIDLRINRHCEKFPNAIFKDDPKITMHAPNTTKQNILAQIKCKWNKFKCDELNDYDTASKTIYVTHWENGVLHGKGTHLEDRRLAFSSKKNSHNVWRFVINDYKNDYGDNHNIVFEYTLHKQERIDNNWTISEDVIEMDSFYKHYAMRFKSNGFVDSSPTWDCYREEEAKDWSKQFGPNESILIKVIARNTQNNSIIAQSNIKLTIEDIGREHDYEWFSIENTNERNRDRPYGRTPIENLLGGFGDSKDGSDDEDILMDDTTNLAYAKRSCENTDRIANNQTCQTHEGIGCFIRIKQTNPFKYDRLGTGVFISDEYIMTAKHVVCHGTKKDQYKFINKNMYFLKYSPAFQVLSDDIIHFIFEHKHYHFG
eukprot:57876_1